MAGRRYLIVDDSAVIRMGIQEGLRRLKVQDTDVSVAANAEDALKIFEEKRPEVVFMDINMPGLSGDQAALKMLEMSPTTRVIMVTGQDPGSDAVRDVVSMGAFAVISKPVRTSDISRVLSELEGEEGGAGRIR